MFDVLGLIMIAAVMIIPLVAFLLLRSPYETSRLVLAKVLPDKEIARRASAYNFGNLSKQIEALAKSSNLDGLDLEQELRRFLASMAANVGTLFVLPPQLQETWHLLILDHRTYHGVSQSLLGKGGDFEHLTFDDTPGIDLNMAQDKYSNAYRELFGSTPILSVSAASFGDDTARQKIVMLGARRGRYVKTWLKEGKNIEV